MRNWWCTRYTLIIVGLKTLGSLYILVYNLWCFCPICLLSEALEIYEWEAHFSLNFTFWKWRSRKENWKERDPIFLNLKSILKFGINKISNQNHEKVCIYKKKWCNLKKIIKWQTCKFNSFSSRIHCVVFLTRGINSARILPVFRVATGWCVTLPAVNACHPNISKFSWD